MENNVMVLLYDALLSSPGMNETVKVNLQVSRKQVLLLGQVMENGLNQANAETPGLLSAMPEGSSEELWEVIQECLSKAGLTDLNEKLKSLNSPKGK